MTQQQRVLNYLKQNGSITSLEMFDNFYICCPQAVIRDLRKTLGFDAITDIWERKNGQNTNLTAQKKLKPSNINGIF